MTSTITQNLTTMDTTMNSTITQSGNTIASDLNRLFTAVADKPSSILDKNMVDASTDESSTGEPPDNIPLRGTDEAAPGGDVPAPAVALAESGISGNGNSGNGNGNSGNGTSGIGSDNGNGNGNSDNGNSGNGNSGISNSGGYSGIGNNSSFGLDIGNGNSKRGNVSFGRGVDQNVTNNNSSLYDGVANPRRFFVTTLIQHRPSVPPAMMTVNPHTRVAPMVWLSSSVRI